MRREESALFVQSVLEHYFPNPSIPLNHSDAYTLLIATVLSAQCTDKRVNAITPKLFAKGATPQAMACLPLLTIQTIIKPCGLSNSKAENIQKLSKILIEEYGAQVPKELEELKKLPGVGQKTASVVLSQAFNIPAFPVDTHIHRCAMRWGLSSGRSVKQTEEDLKSLFPKASWNKLHLQIIHFARKYCPARGHHVENCPICRTLQYRSLRGS